MFSQVGGNSALNARAYSQANLTMWVMANEDDEPTVLRTLQELVKQFNSEFKTDLGIEVKAIPWAAAWDFFNLALKKEDVRPDIWQAPSTWTAHAALQEKSKEIFVPLTIPQEEHFAQAALSSCPKVNENAHERWAGPWFLDIRAVYYNKNIFQKFREEKPSEGLLDPPEPGENWDWTSFEETCQKLKRWGMDKEKKIYPLAYSGGVEWNLLHNLASFLDASEDFFDEQQDEIVLHQRPDAFKAVTFVCHLVKKYSRLEDLFYYKEDVEDKFLRGEYAMVISGNWIFTRAERQQHLGYLKPEEIGVAPIPAPARKQSHTFLGGSNLMLFKKKRTPEATKLAQQFITFLLSPQSQTKYARAYGALPAHNKADVSTLPGGRELKKKINHGRAYPPILKWPLVEFILVKHVGLIWDYLSDASTGDPYQSVEGNYKPGGEDAEYVIRKILERAASEWRSLEQSMR